VRVPVDLCTGGLHQPVMTAGFASKLVNKWAALPLQEKATVAVAGLVTTLVGWKVLTFAVVLLERALVGSILAVEEVLVTSIIKGVSLVSGSILRSAEVRGHAVLPSARAFTADAGATAR
jgi:hypothetical protein